MKNLINSSLFIFVFSFLNAQNTYDPLRYLVVFEEDTPLSEIEDIRQEHQAEEIWVSPFSEIRYWRSSGYPHYVGNDLIGDVKEEVKKLKGRPKVTGGGLNYRVITFVEPAGSGGVLPISCYANFEPESRAHSNSTIVSILDTGLTPYGNYGPEFTFSYGSYTGHNYISDDNGVQDDQGHGTHIAGIISNVSQHLDFNGLNQSDINFDVRKVFDANGTGSISDIILGFDDAVLLGAKVINMSFAYNGERPEIKPDPLEYSIMKAAEEEVLVICAAGNDETNNDLSSLPAFPASYDCDNILSVGSVSCISLLSDFSNYGKNSVDITYLGEFIPGPSPVGMLVEKNGTSQSTAVVSGIATATASYLDEPDYAKVKCAIMNTATYNSNLQGLILSSGVADALEAATFQALGLCDEEHDNVSRSLTQSNKTNVDWNINPNLIVNGASINIDASIDGNFEIQILNLSGEVFMNKSIMCNKGTNSIFLDNISYLSKGTYIIKISNDKIIEHKMFVKL